MKGNFMKETVKDLRDTIEEINDDIEHFRGLIDQGFEYDEDGDYDETLEEQVHGFERELYYAKERLKQYE